MLLIVILADAVILTVTLFFLCGGTLHVLSIVVPSSTSLLPLSIQRGRQWFNLFHWRRLLPFIKLPLDFFFQIIANLEKKKRNHAWSHAAAYKRNNVVLLHWCVIQSPCHLDSHGNYRRGSPECTLQPPDGLPSSWGPGDTSGRMQALATLWTKMHYIMCSVYLRTGGRDCTTSQW